MEVREMRSRDGRKALEKLWHGLKREGGAHRP